MKRFIPIIVIGILILSLGKLDLIKIGKKDKNLNIKCDDTMTIKTPEGRWCHKQKLLNKNNLIKKNETNSELPKCKGTNRIKWHNCLGTLTFADGDKYVGEFKDGRGHGQGTFTWSSGKFAGDKYVGEYKDDKRHGLGTYTYANGDKYVGGWKDSEMHGQGTFSFKDGEIYVGEFKDSNYHGHGTLTRADGEKYVGGWKDGKRHGEGTNTWTDGEKYVGEYKDGDMHGQGTYTFADGRVDKGIFEKGRLIERQ
tara:strand:+ start:40 stop:798 length:759 start_codon:yes stop_codon:yes gene_type:complete